MKNIAARHDHSRKTALLFFANEAHNSSTNTHTSELDSKVILNQISNSIFSKQTFLLLSSISENRIQKSLSILKRSMRQKVRNRIMYNLNRSRLHFFVALKVEKSNYDKKKLLKLRENETQMRTKNISILSLDQLTDLINLDLIFSHMRIFDTTAKTFAAVSTFTSEKKFQRATEAQVGNTIGADKSAVKTKMISVTFKKTSTASAVEASSFDHLSTSSANAIGAANILQTDQNLNPNLIEVSSTALNSKNLKLVSYSLLISSANATEAANILQTNQNLNPNLIGTSSASLNFNVILDSNFDSTSPPQFRTLTEEIQHRKEIAERFQQQKEIQPESESTVNTSAIGSFESENMTLYSTFDSFEEEITSTIETEHSWRLITNPESYSWKKNHVSSEKKSDYFFQNFILDDKGMLMAMLSDLPVFDRRIMYSVNFDRKGVSAKNLIGTGQAAKIMDSKDIYRYIRAGGVEFHEAESRRLNFKRKHEIRNSSKAQSMRVNALFQDLIKRPEDMIY